MTHCPYCGAWVEGSTGSTRDWHFAGLCNEELRDGNVYKNSDGDEFVCRCLGDEVFLYTLASWEELLGAPCVYGEEAFEFAERELKFSRKLW